MTIDAELQRRAARLVEREVLACMSSLVATLANAYGHTPGHATQPARDLYDLTEFAAALTSPVFDYESAAREAGWYPDPHCADAWLKVGESYIAIDPEDACQEYRIEPHELEVYEHWAVSTWLAEKLIEQGERVDTDFAGLNVWARTTTGQAISIDAVIERIVETTGYASAA